MIKSIHLINFQAHADLLIDFKEGVNFVYGNSSSGKSCLRRAISYVLFNSPRTDVIRRTGSKQTSVSMVLDNGYTIERIKSASINRYVVKAPDGTEQTYDNFGSKVPDDVKKVLRVDTVLVDDKEELLNLNISEQIVLPFLMDKSPSFRQKLFNKITGNDVLDKVIQGLNKDILSYGRDVKAKQDFIEKNTVEWSNLNKEYDVVKLKVNTFGSIYAKIKTSFERYTKLSSINDKINSLTSDKITVTETLKRCITLPTKALETLKEAIARHDTLSKLSCRISDLNAEQIRSRQALSGIKVLDQSGFDRIRNNIEKFNALSDIATKYKSLETERILVRDGITKLNTTIIEDEKQYKDKLKEAGVCPICGKSTTECKDG